jgi:hypothetical protein
METYVEFEIIRAVVMNVSIFCDIAQSNPYVIRRFGGSIIHIQATKRHIPEDGSNQNKTVRHETTPEL